MALKFEEFVLTEENLERLSDQEALQQKLSEGKTLQELFGFSNEAISAFYDAGARLIDKERFEDASNGFVFLTTINPYVAEFWMGLGMAEQGKKDYDTALIAFSVAFHLDDRAILPYQLACQCCIEKGDADRAIEILEQAERNAQELPDEETTQQFKKELKETIDYVRSRGSK